MLILYAYIQSLYIRNINSIIRLIFMMCMMTFAIHGGIIAFSELIANINSCGSGDD